MSNPTRSQMEAYLSHLSSRNNVQEKGSKVEEEYLRSIYKVLPRERALEMTLKQARAQTSIRP